MQQARLRCITAIVALGIITNALRADWTHLGPLQSLDNNGAVLTLRCNPGVVRLESFGENVVRVRLSPDGQFPPDFSWAVEKLTPYGKWLIKEEPAKVIATSGNITIDIAREPCRFTFRDAAGNVLAADDPRGMAWQAPDPDGTAPVICWQKLDRDTGIYGLGEKAGPINKAGQMLVMWNTDAQYQTTSDPLYATVPFFLQRQKKCTSGIFFDNPWRSRFDFGRSEQNVLSFGADGGELNYYVIAGPSPSEVVSRYTFLTGRIELPPKWAIGYQQCRYSYYPESRVREVAAEFRKRQIPCDALWFDIDYMEGYRCFTWNKERFPNPRKLGDDVEAMGFHTVAIIDPGIKHEAGYFAYDAGSAINGWLTHPDGSEYVGKVWPGECVFPDFTNPKVRDLWAGFIPKFIEESGLDGIWNDMNEPADFIGPNKTVPLDLRFDNSGRPASHRACHNVYGMQMARASHDGLLKANPELRPFTLTRATYAGGQRYGALWTGDNNSTFEHMAMSISMVINLGLSGVPFVGPDIGGFSPGASPTLYARWIQFGALFPFARTHVSSNAGDQEPWSFGPEVEVAAKKAIERRYQWLPYIYNQFYTTAETGLPIIRPVWMECDDAPGWIENTEFFLGRDILIAPNLRGDTGPMRVYLPEGVWFDGNTGLIHGGKRFVTVSGALDVLPHFFRAGAIIPMQSIIQHTGEKPEYPHILDVWPWAASAAGLYEDDGASFAYKKGAFRITKIRCERLDDTVTIIIDAPEGWLPPYLGAAWDTRTPLARIHGFDETSIPESSDATWLFDKQTNAWLADMPSGQVKDFTVRFKTPPAPAPTPTILPLDQSLFDYVHHLSEPEIADGAITLHVRRPDAPYAVLSRVKVNAESNPILQLRMSTEHAEELNVRFAKEQVPDKLSSDKFELPLTPDGQMHDYSFDLSAAPDNSWKGTIFYVELHWSGNVKPNETIRVEKIAFAPK